MQKSAWWKIIKILTQLKDSYPLDFANVLSLLWLWSLALDSEGSEDDWAHLCD